MFFEYNIYTGYRHGMRNVPYKVLFGQDPICGIRSLSLLSEDLANTPHIEEDLARFYMANDNVDLNVKILDPRTPNYSQIQGAVDVLQENGTLSEDYMIRVSEQNEIEHG